MTCIDRVMQFVFGGRRLKKTYNIKSFEKLLNFQTMRSISQVIVPAVRRAASSAAPVAAQSAKEGFKLVEVRPVYLVFSRC